MQEDVQEAYGGYDGDLYTRVATDCIRYFDLTIEQIDRLTIPEYALMMSAHNLRMLDRADNMHLSAWLTVAAGATDKQGRPVYKRYEKFFNKEKEEERLHSKPSDKFNALRKHLKEKHYGSK